MGWPKSENFFYLNFLPKPALPLVELLVAFTVLALYRTAGLKIDAPERIKIRRDKKISLPLSIHLCGLLRSMGTWFCRLVIGLERLMWAEGHNCQPKWGGSADDLNVKLGGIFPIDVAEHRQVCRAD